jgi:hypothetical protein
VFTAAIDLEATLPAKPEFCLGDEGIGRDRERFVTRWCCYSVNKSKSEERLFVRRSMLSAYLT